MPRQGKFNVRGDSLHVAGMFHSEHDHNQLAHGQPAATFVDSQDAFNHKLFMNGIFNKF